MSSERLKKAKPAPGNHPGAKPATRERIIRAAVRLFQAHGYHGAGLADILVLAEAPKGSLYHHFPGGKEDLALATLEWIAGEVDPFLQQLLDQGAGGSEMVTAMAAHYAAAVASAEGMRANLVAVLAQDAVPGSVTIRRALTRVVGHWAGQLAVGYRNEGARDPDGRAWQSLALLEGATILARIDGNPDRVMQIVRAGTG